MSNKERFIQLVRDNIKREGIDALMDWLETTDFYTAPASSRYHCACPEGLLMHSLNVYDVLMEKHFDPAEDSPESAALCALFHDLCKAGFYKVNTRNVKNDQTGAWEKVPYYAIEDMFPYGHGEKSVYLVERFVRLTPAEATAIRWHMGGFDEAVKGGSFALSHAFEKYPLAVKLHLADLEASYLREKNTSVVNKR